MSEVQRQALARDLSRRLQLASLDELRVQDRILTILEQRRDRVGPLSIRERRDWHKELGEGLLCAVTYCAIETMRAEDEAREELREAARQEMFGPPPAVAPEVWAARDQLLGRIEAENDAAIAEQVRQLNEHMSEIDRAAKRNVEALSVTEFRGEPTRISNEPARIALGETDEPYAEWGVDEHAGEVE